METDSPTLASGPQTGPRPAADAAPAFSFVVPCYNEEPHLAGTVAEVAAAAAEAGLESYEIVMVDDGSTDGTRAVMERLAAADARLRPVVNPRNLGFGGAYKAGVAAAGGTYVMMIPGDNAHPAGGIAPILRCAGQADMVIPYVTNAGVRSIGRRLASRGFVWLMNALFGLDVPYYNGLVVHRLDLLREIEIETDGFAYQAEAIVKLLKRGAGYTTVGVEISARETGTTQAFRPSNVVRVLRALWNLKRKVG